MSINWNNFFLCSKIKYPSISTLLSGKHESESHKSVWILMINLWQKYGNTKIWKYNVDVFNFLRISAIVEWRNLYFNGGLSPEITTIDQIMEINRWCIIPIVGWFWHLR